MMCGRLTFSLVTAANVLVSKNKDNLYSLRSRLILFVHRLPNDDASINHHHPSDNNTHLFLLHNLPCMGSSIDVSDTQALVLPTCG